MAHVVPSVPAAIVTQQPHGQQSTIVGYYVASFSRAKATGFGVLLIIAGVISFSGGIAAIIFNAAFYYTGVGIWSGALFVSTGSVAIAAGKLKTLNLIKAAAGTAGTSIVFSVTQLTISTIGLLSDIDNCNDHYYYSNYYCESAIASNCVIIGGALIAFIFATALAAICGKALRSIPKIQPRIVRPVPHVIAASHSSPVQNVNPALYPVPPGFTLQYVAPVGTGGTLQLVAPTQSGMPMQLQYVMQPQSLPVDYN